MVATNFIDNAKVMSKGQVTIPKDIRKILGIESGDHVTFIVENGNVRIVNSAVYAMYIFQQNMNGEAEKAGLETEDDIMNLVKETRSET
ncbi:MAG: AbrB/MazE/SpoVT family DNA-binding domain-containing protein [Oscillospiraceae bacterium]|nr:AbrB/MazE/SpoVT family DNA-binding domain-containing protein [Oscillospiraceae bacterium]